MKKVIVASLMLAAGSAKGEEVQATKRAPLMTPVENLYGHVEARQTSLRWENEGGEKQTGVASYKLIPRIGTKAYSKRLDLWVESPIVSQARTSNYQQGRSNYQVTFAAYQGDILSVTPYSAGYLPYQGARLESDFAVTVDASKSLNLSGGKFTLHGGIEPQVSTGTQAAKSDAPVVSREGTALTEDGKAKSRNVENQEPTTTLEYIAGVAFVPSFAPKVSFSADAFFDRKYKPTYEVKSDETGDHTEKTGYVVKDTTLTDIVVAYKADDLTTIQSLTRILNDGLYARGKNYDAEDGRVQQVEQRLSLIHKLF